MTLRVAIIEDSADLLDELLAFLRFRGFDAWGVHSAEAFWRQLHRDLMYLPAQCQPIHMERTRTLM